MESKIRVQMKLNSKYTNQTESKEIEPSSMYATCIIRSTCIA